MAEIHKVIAVYGNSGSFKTATSVNLAKAIRKMNSSANIAVVGLDSTKPLIPILFPGVKSEASLGKLLAAERLEQDIIISNAQYDDSIGVIGYNSGENYNSFAAPIPQRIDDFITQMRHLCNYTIIDCNSDVVNDKLTAKALINADEVIYLISCDVNGLVFYHSQEPILLSEQYGYDAYIRFLTENGKFKEDIDGMKNAIGEVQGVIPYSDSITEQWNRGEAFKTLPDSNYNRAINQIADMLMGD